MINEFKLFKPKDRAIKMERIKRLFAQFGLLCFYVDDYTGFLTRKPYDVRFERIYYEPKNCYGTRLTYKKNDKVIDDSIYFSEADIVEWLYRNCHAIRQGEKVLENYFVAAGRFLNE